MTPHPLHRRQWLRIISPEPVAEPGAPRNEGRAVLRGDLDVVWAALMRELDRSASDSRPSLGFKQFRQTAFVHHPVAKRSCSKHGFRSWDFLLSGWQAATRFLAPRFFDDVLSTGIADVISVVHNAEPITPVDGGIPLQSFCCSVA